MVTTIIFLRLEANKYRVLQPAKLESLQAYKLQLEKALRGAVLGGCGHKAALPI
jgi:hypothetical protein